MSGEDRDQPLITCQSGSDGDCFDKRCPQLKDYKTVCPLYKEPDEY